jgi:hypothetical protein
MASGSKVSKESLMATSEAEMKVQGSIGVRSTCEATKVRWRAEPA